jgi:protein-S-isoprenylcysteine O-methyltransferase Ste14
MTTVMRAMGFLIGTWLIYLAPPLLGWGIGDLCGFLAAGPRAGYAILVLLLGLGAGVQAIVAPEGIKGGRKSGQRMRRQSVVKVVVILTMYVGLTFLPFADRRCLAVLDVGATVRWVGLALVGSGYALILWSGFALGRFYSPDVTLQQDHRLVTSGLYRYLRHPRYLGIQLAALGLALLFRSWIGLGLNLPLLAVLLFRIRDEEALLRKTFGAEWDAYCRRSWRLIPYLY